MTFKYETNLFYIKKIWNISRKLRVMAENINYMYIQRNEKFCLNKKKQKESNVKQILHQLFDLLSKINEKNINEIQNQIYTHLRILKTSQKQQNLNECLINNKEKILFEGYLKISNFECKIQERLLFNFFGIYDRIPIKISFMNKINKIFFSKDLIQSTNETNPLKESLFLKDYIYIENRDSKKKNHLNRAWNFRYQDLILEKNLQLLINTNYSNEDYDESVLHSFLCRTDRYDFGQILEFNFKNVLHLFSKGRWKFHLEKNNYMDNLKNKEKIIPYFNNLMKTLLCLLKYEEALGMKCSDIDYLRVFFFFTKSIYIFLERY